MKHRMKVAERDKIALRALELFEAQPSRNEGLFAVEVEFDVSTPTARNLVSRGDYLRRTPVEWR